MTEEQSNLPASKLLDLVRGLIRIKRYCIRTEQAYIDWIRRYVLHFNKVHPKDLGAAEVRAFLTHFAVARRVLASTQNQAKSALLFLYNEMLGHADAATAMICTHVLNKGGRGVANPLDLMLTAGCKDYL